MSSMLETPAVDHARSERSQPETAVAAAAPRHGLSGLISALRSTLVARRQRQPEPARPKQLEMPMDLLAREHPYIYIQTAVC